MIRSAPLLSRLRADRSGVAMLEFALSLPIVLALGLYGIETANLALINMKISQITLALADNASRVGVTTSLSQQQLREVDMNDVMQATRLQGAEIKLTTNGRVTVSSLEESNGIQRIHWQRCMGLKSGANYDSSYGRTTVRGTTPSTAEDTTANYDPTAGVDTDTGTNDNSSSHPGSIIVGGMGDPGGKVYAPTGSGVMFVEVNYLYQPITGSWLMGPSRIHSVASFIVRDRRTFSQIYNPSPTATRATCDIYKA